MNKKIIICGKAACGKNILRDRLLSKGFKASISYTTRAPRNSEVDGIDYFFIDNEKFEQLKEENAFLEYETHSGFKYATPKNIVGDILIMSTDGIKQIPEDMRKECFIIYIDIENSVLIDRLKYQRNWSYEQISERLLVDDKKFKDFNDYDLRITNFDF